VARLFRDDVPIAVAEIARTHAQRRRGLLGRDPMPEVLVMPATSVHTIGMRSPLDVAFCRLRPGAMADALDALPVELHVDSVATMPPGRLSRPRWRERIVLEAPAGSWRRLDVRAGDRLVLR
jgi:uncharacterized membrane protein (UPF0127 family)